MYEEVKVWHREVEGRERRESESGEADLAYKRKAVVLPRAKVERAEEGESDLAAKLRRYRSHLETSARRLGHETAWDLEPALMEEMFCQYFSILLPIF